MGFLSSSTAFTRFFLIGDPPVNLQEHFTEAVRANAFWDIEKTDAERGLGWVEFDDFTSDAFDPPERTFLADLVVLTLRIDKRSIPATVRRLYVKREEDAYRRKTGRKHLSKTEREEIGDKVEKDLLAKILPTPSLYDVIWNVPNATVLLGTTSQAVISDFMELFHKTFGLDLRLTHPFALGETFCNDEQEIATWAEVEPAVFSAISAGEGEGESHE